MVTCIVYSPCDSSSHVMIYFRFAFSPSCSNMPSSWGSQCIAWSDTVDSSSSELENPKSWSNLTDSDEGRQALDAWSPCSSWSVSDWSPCPSWSSSDNNSNHHLGQKWEVSSSQSCSSSQPSNKCDKD